LAPLSSWINLTEEAEYRGRRADILVDRELAGHRGAVVAEPAFIAGPGVDAPPMNRYRCFPPRAVSVLPWGAR
jgi:hypothetical protein